MSAVPECIPHCHWAFCCSSRSAELWLLSGRATVGKDASPYALGFCNRGATTLVFCARSWPKNSSG
eukprot:475685-Alexandrium_andersonii.AAC.1